MYKIHHNTDGEKTTTCKTVEKFIKFVQQIRDENQDSETIILSEQGAKCYLDFYCPNLTVSYSRK